ncbi:Nitroreductase-like protein [Biscogniauxia mediterranea]|nr:Nitroreductase-like protein [Biscogniauxia mediterranea]
MRPRVLTSALFSAIRFHSTSTFPRTLASAAPSSSLSSASSLFKTPADSSSTCPASNLSHHPHHYKPFSSSSSSSSSSPAKPTTTTNNNNNDNMATPINAKAVLDLISNRRTYYALNKELPISKERIQEIVSEAVQQVPSSFNSQSNRVVVLFGAEHDKFWDITTEILKGIVEPANWQATADRQALFKNAAGTILFFEDQTVVSEYQQKFALYKDRFPTWATQSDAMLQFALWTALEAEGLGANLQHYNPLVDERVRSEWDVPASWLLNAQLVFGGRATADPGPKDYAPVEQKVKVFGA